MPHLSCKGKKYDYRCTVRLLDDSEILQCEFQGKENGQFLIDQVCAHLDLVEKEYFGLCFEDINKSKEWLEPTKQILKQVKGVWPMVLSFRVKFYPGWPERLQEELTRYQVYLQLRRDLRAGRLTASDEEAAQLAALVLQVETDDCELEQDAVGGEADGGGECPAQAYPWLVSPHGDTAWLQQRLLQLHCCGRRRLSPSQAEMALLKRAAQLDLYGLRLQPFKDQRGNAVSLGLNYRGISVVQDYRRTHLFRWQDVQKLNFENKMFIVHLLFTEDSRAKIRRTMGFKSDSVLKCRYFWRHATEHRLFFTCDSSRSAPRMVLGGSLFSRHSRVRFSGRTEKEVARQPIRRDPPQFSRYGLRPMLDRKSHSVPATPCESQQVCSVHGSTWLPHDSTVPEHTSLADDETMMVSAVSDVSGGGQLQPLTETTDFTPPSSRELSPLRAVEESSEVETGDAGPATLPGPRRPDTAVARLQRQVPPTPPPAPTTVGWPAVIGPPMRPLLLVLLSAVLTVLALVLLTLVAVFELDTPATRELRAFPEVELLRRRLYEPVKQYVVRGGSV